VERTKVRVETSTMLIEKMATPLHTEVTEYMSNTMLIKKMATPLLKDVTEYMSHALRLEFQST
jgi:hypothetical protein